MKIKKSLLIFFLLPALIHAQSLINYGIKIGATASQSSGLKGKGMCCNMYESLYKETRYGGAFSIFVQFLKSDNMRFEFDLGYRQEGAEDKLPVTSVTHPEGTGQFVIIDYVYDFLSLNLGIHPKYENDDVCIYGIISPSLNILLKFRDQLIMEDDVDKIIPGWNLGIGFQPKNLLNGNLFVELKFGSSFTKYVKSDFFETRFNTIQLSIGSFINH